MKNSKSGLILSTLLTVSLLLTVLLTACGSSKKSEMVTEETYKVSDVADSENAKAGSAYGYNKSVEGTSTSRNSADGDSDGNRGNQTTDTSAKNDQDIRKIIKNGEMSLEVKDVGVAYEQISVLLKELGGYEFSKQSQTRGQYKQIIITVKIPPQNLEAFEKGLTGSGKMTSNRIWSDDITSAYYDTAARLQNLKNGRDQLNEMLKKTTVVDETLKVWNEINRIQGEIDSLSGQISMWDKLVSMSTITVRIDEEQSPIAADKNVDWRFSSPDEILKAIRNGFINTVNIIYNIIVWFVIILVSASPLLVIVAILVAIWIYRKKSRKKKE